MIAKLTCYLFGHRWHREPYQRVSVCVRCARVKAPLSALIKIIVTTVDPAARIDVVGVDAEVETDEIIH